MRARFVGAVRFRRPGCATRRVYARHFAALVRTMFTTYQLVLTVAPSGGRRTFQNQYDIATDGSGATDAGPGESNHNFGQAVDIGFNHLK